MLNPVRKLRNVFWDLTTSQGLPFEEEQIKAHLEVVQLPAHVLRVYPFKLSGEMRQRSVIALATFLKPEVIVADEPTSALDVVTQHEILQLLKSIQIREKSIFLFIIHDISLVPDSADVMAIMYGADSGMWTCGGGLFEPSFTLILSFCFRQYLPHRG